ncbi:hypothetical protein QWZ08_01050 [Ferruginibacter paludis]|uniref:hypothetical protein n=1 Tax=Ferruginibacter paludis TaxID=1310417 RepID=UPI0025B56E80|nr:hypothetical protein [Ferruginibacter paludis]MDN3654189.1 hypothetical protein [Ferruginibacter paludis]
MKKVVFAIQVFGLLAMFPVCITAELNRGSETVPVNNTSRNIIKEPTKTSIQSKVKTPKENIDKVLFLTDLLHF